MIGGIITIAAGIACIVIGILNTKGNISMMHSYHIDNIKEEDKPIFGKIVGSGMIIVGVSLTISGVLLGLVELGYSDASYGVISTVIMIVGLVVGLGICFYATKKYNKKIF